MRRGRLIPVWGFLVGLEVHQWRWVSVRQRDWPLGYHKEGQNMSRNVVTKAPLPLNWMFPHCPSSCDVVCATALNLPLNFLFSYSQCGMTRKDKYYRCTASWKYPGTRAPLGISTVKLKKQQRAKESHFTEKTYKTQNIWSSLNICYKIMPYGIITNGLKRNSQHKWNMAQTMKT